MLTFLLWSLLGPAQAGDAHVYSCCSKRGVDDVVDAWLDVHEVLTASSPSDTKLKGALAELAKAASVKLTPEEQPVADEIEAIAKRRGSDTVEALRSSDDLGVLAGHVAWLSLRYEGGNGGVVQARCAGLGVWLQRDTTKAKNPWGQRCGRLL